MFPLELLLEVNVFRLIGGGGTRLGVVFTVETVERRGGSLGEGSSRRFNSDKASELKDDPGEVTDPEVSLPLLKSIKLVDSPFSAL